MKIDDFGILLNSLNLRYGDCKSFYDEKVGAQKAIQQKLDAVLIDVKKYEELDISYVKLQKFFQSLGTTEQVKLQEWLQKVVTYGMQTVFGRSYFFVIRGPEIKGSEVVLDFKIIEVVGDKQIEREPYGEMGGGIADVLSFLLQFLIVFLLRDRIEPVMFLDEAYKHLAAEYRPGMANLLSELVERTKVQIILVTHEPIYSEAADVVYEFNREVFETSVVKIK